MSSYLLPSITQTRAAGVNRTNYVSFNDVDAIGEFPVDQKIERIAKIEVWTRERVMGFRVVYVFSGGGSRDILHGRAIGTAHHVLLLREGDLLVGVLGHKDAQGDIASITFVLYETAEFQIVQHGPWGNPGPPQAGAAFGAFGHIIAFAGTDENAYGLCSLSFIKDDIPVGLLLPAN